MIEDSNQSKAQWKRKINFRLHYLCKDNTGFYIKHLVCVSSSTHISKRNKKDDNENQEK